jgi:hypothetical protein
MNGKIAFLRRSVNRRLTSPGALLALLLTILVLALPVHAAAQDFGTVSIGQTSAAKQQTLTFTRAGTVSTIAALTQGTQHLDFTVVSGGSCTVGSSYNVGDTCTVKVTFTPTLAGFRNGAVTLQDGSGNIIATGYVRGIGSGPQVSFLPMSQHALGSGFSHFDTPFGVAVDGAGNVFFANFANYKINAGVYEILAKDGSVNLLGGGFSFGTVTGVAVDGAGNVFFADSQNNAVYEIPAPNYSTVKQLGGGFYDPWGIAVDWNGNVFVADSGNKAVKEILAPGYSTVKTLGSAGSFSFPVWVAVDGKGNVFVGDNGDGSVREILAAGGYTTVNLFADNVGADPGVAVDGIGNLFVTAHDKKTLSEYMAASGYATVSTYQLGNGFAQPEGIAVDGSGNVFITDFTNNIVVKLDYADAPSLTFATATPVGKTDTTDPAQTVTVQNIGNAPLTFQPFVAGNLLDAVLASSGATDCSVLSNLQLASGAACTLGIEFAPAHSGLLSGYVKLVDNALNAALATQTITLQGKGTQGTGSINFPNPGPQTYGTPLQLTATAPSVATIIFTVTSGPASVTGSTLTFTGTGSVTVRADQAANADYTAATASVTFTVNPAPLTVTANNKTRSYGSANPSLDGTLTGVVSADNITATYATTATATSDVGAYPITATLIDLNKRLSNYVVTNTSGTLTITAVATATKLQSSATTVNLPSTFTLTAKVSSTAGTPAGTVTFSSGTTSLGTATLDNTGTANLAVTTAPTGTDSITAAFIGSKDYAASSSGVVTVIVYSGSPNYNLKASPTTLSIKQGQSGTTTISLTGVNGYAGTVSFSCGSLPAGMGCNFAPASLVAKTDGSAVTSILTITTTGPTAMLNRAGGNPLFAMYWAMGFGAFGFVLVGTGIRRKTAVMILLAMLTLALMLSMAACGGSSSSSSGNNGSGTPVGSSIVTVSAVASASGTQPATPTQAVSLTVNVTQ